MRRAMLLATAAASLTCSPTATAATAATTASLTSADGSVTAAIGSSGITSLKHGGDAAMPLSRGAKTELSPVMAFASASCKASGDAKVVDLQPAQKAVAVTQAWRCAVSDNTSTPPVTVIATVTDTFTAAARSIAVNSSITTDKPVPFTVQLDTALEFAALPTNSSYWLPFGKGCVQNAGKVHGMCLAGGEPWSSALAPEPLPTGADMTRYYRYGGTGVAADIAGTVPPQDAVVADMFSVPITTLLPAAAAAAASSAFSLALDPADPILELTLAVGATGVAFGRELLRIGGPNPLTFSAHVVAHASCWRPGLQFITTQFPSFFLPWVEHASEFEGLGSYSWNQEPYNTTRAKAIGFKTNWDLSGTWMPCECIHAPLLA
jgi:hypothetical protein